MNSLRHRKIEAREKRQESLHNRGITAETTTQFPYPKNLAKNETVKVEPVIKKEITKINKLPKALETVKRGRGRPPKAVSINDNNKKEIKKVSTKKLATMSVKKSSNKSKEKK